MSQCDLVETDDQGHGRLRSTEYCMGWSEELLSKCYVHTGRIAVRTPWTYRLEGLGSSAWCPQNQLPAVLLDLQV